MLGVQDLGLRVKGLGFRVYLPGDPNMQIVPTLGPKVSRYYLHSAIRIPRLKV